MNGTMRIFLALSIAASLIYIPAVDATETEGPEPPRIPDPLPEPGPIRVPEPEPIPNPFLGETESEKIQRLTEENEKLRQKNMDLQDEIFFLNHDKLQLESKISELNAAIQGLKEIIMEQARVILDLSNKLKQVLFENALDFTAG